MSFLRSMVLFVGLVMLQACATTTNNQQAMIQGIWQSNLGGFTVKSTYTADEIITAGGDSIGYLLKGETLTLAGDATTQRLVSFPNSNEMIQVDPMTNTEHRFERAP
jgi:hypothetical protein